MTQIELIKFSNEDLSLIEKWYRNDHVRKYWDANVPWEECRPKFIDVINKDSFIISSGSLPVGFLLFTRITDSSIILKAGSDNVFLIDIFIGEQSQLRKGIASMAIKLGMGQLGSDQRVFVTNPTRNNIAAIKMFFKNGFKKLNIDSNIFEYHLYSNH